MKDYTLSVTELAKEDLKIGQKFYERQSINSGDYFIDSLLTDLESLKFYAGIHKQHFDYYKMLAKRFPFAIYYDIEGDTAVIHAILDTRQNPSLIKIRLK